MYDQEFTTNFPNSYNPFKLHGLQKCNIYITSQDYRIVDYFLSQEYNLLAVGLRIVGNIPDFLPYVFLKNDKLYFVNRLIDTPSKPKKKKFISTTRYLASKLRNILKCNIVPIAVIGDKIHIQSVVYGHLSYDKYIPDDTKKELEEYFSDCRNRYSDYIDHKIIRQSIENNYYDPVLVNKILQIHKNKLSVPMEAQAGVIASNEPAAPAMANAPPPVSASVNSTSSTSTSTMSTNTNMISGQRNPRSIAKLHQNRTPEQRRLQQATNESHFSNAMWASSYKEKTNNDIRNRINRLLNSPEFQALSEEDQQLVYRSYKKKCNEDTKHKVFNLC